MAIAIAAVLGVLLVGVLAHVRSPGYRERSTRFSGPMATRSLGTVELISGNRDAVCIRTLEETQVCATPRLLPGEEIPEIGAPVRGHDVMAPAGEARSLGFQGTWVGLYSRAVEPGPD